MANRGWKERWKRGQRAWFEYHCWEDPESGDAEIWYRSHQRVVILDGPSYDDLSIDDDPEPWGDSIERAEDGTPWAYRVRFADGLEWTVFEDELTTTRTVWDRPDPPVQQSPKALSR